MSYSKNTGRKRLGRIAISGPSLPAKRSCQIVQRNDINTKLSVVSESHQSFNTDLSFSVSFNDDSTNDLDLMSALDKMECDLGTRHVTSNMAAKKPGTMLKEQSDLKDNQSGINMTRKSLAAKSINKDFAVSLMSPPITTDRGKNSRNKSIRENIESFLDLSFTSPMEVNTPQVFKKKVDKRPSGSKSVKEMNSTSVTKTRPQTSSASPAITPRRSTRKKKRVLDCLVNVDNDNHHSNTADKSDFFKSLVEDISIGEIDDLDKNGKTNELVPVQVKLQKANQGTMGMKQSVVDANADNEVEQMKENTKFGNDGTISKQTDNDKEISVDDIPLIPSRNKDNASFNTSRRLLEIKPSLGKDQLALSSWDLPETVLKQYESRGITHMFEWQAQCLLLDNVLDGGNLVYSAPTSAGKTMVAELLVLKRVIETRKKAIFILPFVSVTREKMFYLQELYQDAGIRVSGFMGHYAPAGGFSSVDVAVCTIEKGNGLINRMLEDNKLDQLGIIVVDEMHLIGDSHRGYLLELLLTKIVYMSKKVKLQTPSEPSTTTSCDIQIVGMSATLPNLDLLAQWLNAGLYCTDYRPVPLTECVKIGTALYDNNMKIIKDIDITYAVKGDDEHVIPLCIETIKDGHSILIFCPTKNWCEKLAETVAREFYNLLRNGVAVLKDQNNENSTDILKLPLDQSSLKDIIEQLRRTPVGIDNTLGRTVPYGVAYHHAGLTFDERDIVEGAFRQGILKVLVATSTLSSGVNLPARRVLIRTPVFHGQLIDFLTYKQMIGRAGRKGVDTAGESILLCKPNERSKAEKLVQGSLPSVHSTLIKNEDEPLSSSLKRAILEVVVSGVATTPDEVSTYASCTLLAASLTKDQTQTSNLIQECVTFLEEYEFVCKQTIAQSDGAIKERYVPTQLGSAVLSSSISPDEGLVVFSELVKARQCFVLENELHIIYQVTPIYAQLDSIDWYQYFNIWENLSSGMRKVAELVGIQESFLSKAVRGRILTKTSSQQKVLAIHKRFYTALVLHDLVQETPLNVVVKRYNCNKGQLQSLQQSAATFAGMVTVFCARLGWSNLELILSQFQNRLTFGVQRELCDLVRISALNGQRARVMYNGGYQTVAALASAHPADVEALLKNSAPFQSNKRQDCESEWEAIERKKMRCIYLTGRKGVTELEAAVAIINEAKSIIQEELGGIGVQWDSNKGQEPCLKSPVLLSPLASNPRKKKSRLSSNKRKSTDPVQQCLKSPSDSMMSPPAKRSSSKLSENNRINVSGSAKLASTITNESTSVMPNIRQRASGPDKRMAPEVDRDTDNVSQHNGGTCSDLLSAASSKVLTMKNKLAVGSDGEMFDDGGENSVEKEVLDKCTERRRLDELKQNMETKLVNAIDTIEINCKVPCSKVCDNVDVDNEQKRNNRMGESVQKDDLQCNNICDMLKQGVSDLNCCKINSNDKGLKMTPENRVNCSPESVTEISLSNVNSGLVFKSGVGKKTSIAVEDEEIGKNNSGGKHSEVNATENDIEIPTSAKTILSNCDSQIKIVDNKTSELVDDFGESFIIDTQGMESLEKQSTGDMTSKTVDVHHMNSDRNKKIGPLIPSSVSNIDNTNKRGEHIMEIHSNLIGKSNKKQEKEVVVNDSLNDSFQSTIVNGHVVNNGNDISDNVLDMNISDGSDEDMFGNSGDLVAASNYEHVGINDSISDHNNSYEDLHIPYQSGQEKCFENADIDNYHCNGVKINSNPVGNFKEHSAREKGAECGFGQQLKVLGKFSTPILTSPVNNGKKTDLGIHEDLAIALEMAESFSSTFNVPTQRNDVDKHDKDVNKVVPSSDDHFSDSLSISMMDKVFEHSISNQLSSENEDRNNLVANDNPIVEQNSCDRPNLNNGTSRIKQSEHNLDEHSQVTSTPATHHRTLRSSNSNKNSKSQKIKDDNKFVIPSGNCPVKSNTITNSAKTDTKKVNICITPLSVKNVGRVVSNPNTVNTSPDLDTSNVSDCVPPTPPGESSISVTLPSGGGDTPKRRALPASSCMSPFSPRLKRKIENNSPSCSPKSKAYTEKEENHITGRKILNSDNSKEMASARKNHNIVLTDVITNRSGNESDVNRTIEKESVTNGIENASENKTGVKDSVECENDEDINVNAADDNDVVAVDGDADEDILNPSFISPIEAGLALTQSSFSIIDVCGDRRLFKTFILEWRTKPRYTLSLACEKLIPTNKGPGIGANFKTGETPKKSDIKEGYGISLDSLGIKIVGLAICWENRDVYYISFTNEQPQGDPDDSLAAPPCDTNISIAIRIKAVKSVLQQTTCDNISVVMSMFDIKTHYRCFVEGFGFSPLGQFEDPKVACWMLDPGAKEKNLHRMVTNLLPADVPLLHGIGGGVGVDSLGINPRNPGSGRYRSCIESVLVSHLCEYFNICLNKEDIYKTYKDVEMPATITLCRMELNGFGFSFDESESQKSIMLAKLSALEEQAYTIAKHPFSLSSSEDIAQVLFIELQLPPNGDPSATPAVKSLIPKRGPAPKRGRGRPQYSTSKDILEKLQKLHPLPGIILEWRRITNALTKTVFPLQKARIYCDWLSMYRIYGDCQCHTATGRISMTEPNLQNVPKDFDIVLPDLIGESPPPTNIVQQSRTRRKSRIQQMIGQQQQVAMVTDNNTGSKCCLSMRNVFIPFTGGVLLAADYSQLELRMISYLSNDDKLMNILNKDGDVFKLITAQWKNISVDNVTTEQRAQAKQVCYGMIYGIGAKTLSEQLDVDENDAAVFIETFKAKYPGMKRYLRTTVELCRKQGYVQTMLGRKRYLQSITSTNPHARAQAERQAINTTVQGSAADLVKIAMIKIDERLKEMFPQVQYTHKQKPSGKSSQRSRQAPEGGYLVLQLHDELIYEVTECHVDTVAQIVKSCMETAMTLPVKMPVKIKVGPSWGKLEDYQV